MLRFPPLLHLEAIVTLRIPPDHHKMKPEETSAEAEMTRYSSPPQTRVEKHSPVTTTNAVTTSITPTQDSPSAHVPRK